MAKHAHNPAWAYALPLLAWIILLAYFALPKSMIIVVLLCAALIGGVVSAVHHAEVIAHRVGEPFGTLVLALSVTLIESALIVSMMLSGGDDIMTLPRDTIFAAVMIILNAIIGLSLISGGRRHGVQSFNVEGMTDALCTIAVIVGVGMVLPNFTTSTLGPTYSTSQLLFVAIACLVLFAAFTVFQTVSHRSYFVPETTGDEAHADDRPDNKTTLISLALLIVSLVAVVLSAKGNSPTLEGLLGRWGAPAAVLGIIIAAIVLLPEFGAAMRAANTNRLQASLNLAIGSAIASIALTIPVVAFLAIYMGWPIELGLDAKSIVLLSLSLFVIALTLRTGNTTLQPGVVHLVIFAIYLFFSFAP